MAKMFYTRTDENGVEISCNAHSEMDYEHPPAEQEPGWPHLMIASGSGPYIDPPAQGLIHKTKDKVLNRLGRPGVGMYFDGDLLPRSERK